MTKILCIDDTPEEILTSGLTLKKVITNIFKDTPYKVSFKKTGAGGVKDATEDVEIKLVLLDVEFNKKMEGPEIADKLQAKAPHTKIIVLTRIDKIGEKIRFGWKPNVVHYVLKKNLSNTQVLQKLKNLSKAIIEDYENKNWEIECPAASTINLTNKTAQITYGIDIPSSMDIVIRMAVASPNKPVDNPGGSTPGSRTQASLNKVLNTINGKVLEGTDWNTWGILSRDHCAKGQLKLVIGSVVPSPIESLIYDIYVTQSEFEKFKKKLEHRLNQIEQTQRIESPQKNN